MTLMSTPAWSSRRGVAQHVGGDGLGPQAWAVDAGALGVERDAVLDRIATERSALPGGQDWCVGDCGRFGQPVAQDVTGDGRQRSDTVLAALAVACDVGAGAEVDVTSGQCDELGDPEPALDSEDEHRVVASSGPGGLVAGAEQRVDLEVGEVVDDGVVAAFGKVSRVAWSTRTMVGGRSFDLSSFGILDARAVALFADRTGPALGLRRLRPPRCRGSALARRPPLRADAANRRTSTSSATQASSRASPAGTTTRTPRPCSIGSARRAPGPGAPA